MTTLLLLLTVALETTPAEKAITQARIFLEKDGQRAEDWAALGAAYVRRARETGDPAYYSQADEAVRKSLEAQADNFAALKVKTWTLLGRHEFAAARDLAQKLNKRMPDDILVYGFLTDAHAALGEYDEAEKSCNWMLRLRAGHPAGLTRAAQLRELFGDLEGALDLMVRAYQATPLGETEERAWMMVHLGRLTLAQGKTADAGKAMNEALVLFPEYHLALAGLGRVKLAQKDYSAAAEFFSRSPSTLYDWADALSKAGRAAEAKKLFAEFEAKALAVTNEWNNANRELVFYYTDHERSPKKALEVAAREYALRRDVFTRDAYAWALRVNGRAKEAREQYEAIEAVGVRDSRILARSASVNAAAAAMR